MKFRALPNLHMSDFPAHLLVLILKFIHDFSGIAFDFRGIFFHGRNQGDVFRYLRAMRGMPKKQSKSYSQKSSNNSAGVVLLILLRVLKCESKVTMLPHRST